MAESIQAGERTAGELAALAVCDRCPVLARCRTAVLSVELPYGVAGAMTVADRRAARATRRGLAAVVEPVQHAAAVVAVADGGREAA